MKLKNLTIGLQPSYCENAGKYVGEISYEGVRGEVKMILDEKVSEAVLICIGDAITEFASRAAREVADNIIASVDQAKQIKNPAVDLP